MRRATCSTCCCAARDPETGAGFSREQLRDQIATMILAGHETTAVTLFWSLVLLAGAPDEQERVADEAGGVDVTPDNAMEVLAAAGPHARGDQRDAAAVSAGLHHGAAGDRRRPGWRGSISRAARC